MTVTLPPSTGTGEQARASARRRRHFPRYATAGLLVLAILVPLGVVAATVTPAGQAQPASDALGRVGFVVIVAAALATVLLLDARTRSSRGPATDIFVPTRFIVAVFGVFAGLWVVYDHLVLDAFSRGRFGYLEWLTQVTTLAAARGLWNIWTPYPQGTQVVMVGLQAAASGLGALAGSDVWTSYTFFRLGFELVFLVVPAVVSVWLVAAAARPFGRATATIAALTLSLSFAIVYYGAATVYVTDLLPVALSIASIVAVFRGKLLLAGVAIGLGAALKLFPLLLLLPLLVLLPRREGLRVCAAAAVVLVLAFGPFAVLNWTMFLSPFNWQASRPPWETWFAFVNWASGAPHDFPQPYFEDASVGGAYSWVFTGITPAASVLQAPVPNGPLRWENVTSLALTLLTLGVLVFVARRRVSPNPARSIVRWCLCALCAAFVFSIGWSPQYELYLIPLVLLAFDNPLVGAAAALGLQAVTFLDYPLLLPWAYFYGGAAVWLEWGSVLARYVILGWLCVWVVRTELRASASGARRRLAHLVPLVVALLAPVSLAFAAPVAQTGTLSSPGETCGPTRVTSAPMSPGPSDADWAVSGGWFYAEASRAPGAGYAITDDDEAHLYSEFKRLGGWQVLGYPASQRFEWHGILSQVTQRAVLQWSPVTGTVDFANVLDLLHDDGFDPQLQQMEQIPPPLDVDEAGLPYETIATNRLSWLDSRPSIKVAYCSAPGGGDPVDLWGLPTSQAVNMGGPGGDVYVLRTQRAAFQEWVSGAPWAAPGQVTVVLAGDLAKEFELLPAAALSPESPTRSRPIGTP
jgi:hypothetical protein